jgi:hypothetical protein
MFSGRYQEPSMENNFVSFADQVLIALADQNSPGRASPPDLRELCERSGIPYQDTWLMEQPRYLEQQGYGSAESTMKSWRFRIRGAGLARAVMLRRAMEAAALEASPALSEILPLSMDPNRANDPAEKRFDFLIEEASREIPQRLKSLYADLSAKGLLKSGATIKRAVMLTDEMLRGTVDACLQAVSTVTSVPGSKRDYLLNLLYNHIVILLNLTKFHVAGDLSRFGFESDMVLPLLEEVRVQRLSQIEQYRAGWTAPAKKTWKERHPTLHDIALVLVSGGVGVVVGWLTSS